MKSKSFFIIIIVGLASIFLASNGALNSDDKGISSVEDPVVSRVDDSSASDENADLFDIEEVSRKTQDTRPIQSDMNELKKMKLCSKKQNCNYSKESPRSYYAELNQDVVRKLREVYRISREQGIQNSNVVRLGRSFLFEDSDDVKVEALKILTTQPLDSNTIDIIFSEVLNAPNPKSTAVSMQILAQYKEGDTQREIAERLSQVLTNGGVYAALEVAKNLPMVLNDQNKDIFVEAYYKIEEVSISQKVSAELKKQLNL